jgi:peptidoglycan hydrolase-like protein with peptidoglycan-binding domain
MKTSKPCWLVMGMLCLVLWPAVIAAHGDWRIGQAQERLKAAGFNPGPIDGVLGPQTRAALRRYQASQGLPATGALDEATRPVLALSERPPEGGEAKPGPWLKAPPGGEYQKMSSLFQLPDFFSGLGMLYVQPSTLPVGPYLAYDRNGNLVSTVHMIPLRDLRAGKAFSSLVVPHGKVDHVDIYYNNGHPGVPDPHYHVVLWYIPAEQAALLE